MANSGHDQNHVATLSALSSVDGVTIVPLYADPTTHRLLVDLAGGSGTVTSVSVVTANGFAGTVADETTTPAITISTTVTGILQGNGTAISAITVGSGLDFTGGTLSVTGFANTALSNLASVAINTTLLPGSNDGAGLGSGTLSFSDLFLASGGIINWNNGTAHIAQAGSYLTVKSNGTEAAALDTSLLSTTRVFTFPDATGTLALTSDIPAAGANTALSNLASVAINTSLISDTTNTDDLGSSGTTWRTGYFGTSLVAPQVINAANAIAASGNAATVPVTFKNNIVTNNSAATLTITLTTTNAVNMQQVVVQILDFSAVAQTITWVNTENSTISAPTTSNGSTTLPLTVGFIYNSATSKWRCVASA